MAKKIRWSPYAVDSLAGICEFISRDSVHYATIFASRVLESAAMAAKFPRSGRIVPEYRSQALREVILGSYRIVYRVRKEAIEVVTVVHGSRLLRLNS